MSHEGGLFGAERIQWFNGGLFDGPEVLPMATAQVSVVRNVARLDWSQVEPAIFGTLFERGLDPRCRDVGEGSCVAHGILQACGVRSSRRLRWRAANGRGS